MKTNETKKPIRVEIDRFTITTYGLRGVIVEALLKAGYEVDIRPIRQDNGDVKLEEITVYEIQNYVWEEGNKY